MAAGHPLIAEKHRAAAGLVGLPRIHGAHDRRQHGIGAQKAAPAGNAGRGAAKAVDAAGGAHVARQGLRRDAMHFALFGRQRCDDIGFDLVQPLIGDFGIHHQIPHHRRHIDGLDDKFRGLKIPDRVLHQQFTGQKRFAVDTHRTGAALAVFAG